MADSKDYEQAYGRLAQYNIVDDNHADVAQRMTVEGGARARAEAAEKSKKEKAAASRKKNTKNQPNAPVKSPTISKTESATDTRGGKNVSQSATSASSTSAGASNSQSSSSARPSSQPASSSNPTRGRTAGQRRQNGYIVSTPYPASTSTLDILKGPWDRIRYEALWRVSKEYSPAQIVATFNANHPVNEHLTLDIVTGRVYSMKAWYGKENGLSKEQVNTELEEAQRANGVVGRAVRKGGGK